MERVFQAVRCPDDNLYNGILPFVLIPINFNLLKAFNDEDFIKYAE